MAHVNPGTDTTINPIVINDSLRSNSNKGELVYGSITKNGEDWRLRKFDGGMGESEYRIFKDGVLFARFDNRKDADTIMELMTTSSAQAWAIKAPAGHILLETIRRTQEGCIRDKILVPWEMYENKGYRCVRVRVEEIEE